jgi:ABC-type branched-subunit amino acid transport system substrate-binding protein
VARGRFSYAPTPSNQKQGLWRIKSIGGIADSQHCKTELEPQATMGKPSQTTKISGRTATCKRSILAFVLVCAGVFIAGCATNLGGIGLDSKTAGDASTAQAVQKNPGKPATVTMLLPLKGFGKTAIVGKSMKQAGEMALFESGNPNIQLIVKNDDGTAEGAAAAAREAIAEGAELIVGPLFGKSVPSVAAEARPTNVPVLSFSNDRTVAGNGVYLMSFLPEAETNRIVSYAISRGKRRFAALIPVGAYGDTVEQAFRSAVQRGGGTIIASERFQPGANAMLESAKRVFDIVKEAAELGAPVEALFVPGNQDTLPILGPQMAYANIDTRTTQLLGLGGWEFPNIGRDQVFVGGWYPGQDPQSWQRFSERFAKTFGQAPPRVASHAYDAINLAVELSSRPQGQKFTTANLTSPAGFEGISGRFTLNADGTTERKLAILEVQRFGSKLIDDGTGSDLPQSPAFRQGSPRPVWPSAPSTATSSGNAYPVQPIAGQTAVDAPL